ncbi:MAG TPA: hypothetical protein VKR21_07265 [Solirubrobacteraceae bacterium]|nr:hypothetical protein [Solirubrobacteraceae bacterium]
MPKFCRHNRLLQNCPICTREQAIELRPILSSGTPRVSEPRERSRPASLRRDPSRRAPSGPGLKVRRLRSAADDGFRSGLVPGLKSSDEAARLAEEVGFAGTRLRVLSEDPPGLYAEVAAPETDLEERTWLAFLIAYLGPLEEGDPFAVVSAARTSWASGEAPHLGDVDTGPRSAHDPARGARTPEAYRAWAARSGSQAAALGGDPGWRAERRFERAYERLALPGMNRDARFELLVSLGVLGVYDVRAGGLELGGSDDVTVAAKRALGIGDPLLLERRAAQLAEACQVPLAALDLAFYNWERGERVTAGLGSSAQADPAITAAAREALGL